MKHALKAAAFALAATLPATAFAYVGPGAGLSLLGALWALVAALGMALLFVVAWPLRRMLRRRRAAGGASSDRRRALDEGAEVGMGTRPGARG